MISCQSRSLGRALAPGLLLFTFSASCAWGKSAIEDLPGPLKSKIPDITVTYLTSPAWNSSQSSSGHPESDREMSSDTGVVFAIGGGNPKKWYWDVEAGRRSAEGEGDMVYLRELSTLSLMGNSARAFDIHGKFKGFVGLGAGVARHESPGSVDYALAWQVLLGLDYELTKNISGQLGLRYFATQESVVHRVRFSYGRPEVGIGVKLKF